MINYIDSPQNILHGTKVERLKKIDDLNYLVKFPDGTEKKVHITELADKRPIMIGDVLKLPETHWSGKAKKGEKVTVIGIEYNEHLSSRSYCCRYSYAIKTSRGKKVYFDDYQIKKNNKI